MSLKCPKGLQAGIIVVIFSLLFGLCSCGKSGTDTNVLVITVDTQRADRLGCYGYANALTPVADRLAEEGILFENVSTTAPLTLPAHTSLFTSLYPVSHGLRENTMFSLNKGYKTLAEIFADNEYSTGAIIASEVLNSSYGLNQGFDYYADEIDIPGNTSEGLLLDYKRGEKVTAQALEWVLGKDKANPYFMWVHYFDPHYPYKAPEPFASKFPDKPYDGEVAYVDSCIGVLLDKMKEKGKLDNTLIVYVADHGEDLGDHGEFTHGYFGYEGTLHIPLIMKFPSNWKGGKRVSNIASIVDIFPTVLEYLNIDFNDNIEGESLLSVIDGKSSGRKELFFESMDPYYALGWSGLAGIRTENTKYMYTRGEELYFLDKDEKEKNNLYSSEQQKCDNFRKKVIEDYLSKKPLFNAPSLSLSDEKKAQLLSLGYLQANPLVEVSPDHNDFISGNSLKDSLPLWLSFFKAASMGKAGRTDRGVELMTEILKKSGGHNYLFYRELAAMQFQIGRYEEALKSLNILLSIHQSDIVVEEIEKCLKQKEEQDKILTPLESEIKAHPSDITAYIDGAKYFADLKDYNRAFSWLERGLKIVPDSAKLYNSYGICLAMAHETEEGIKYFEKAISLDSTYTDAYMNLAFACFRNGNSRRATELLEGVLSREPGNLKARQMLKAFRR